MSKSILICLLIPFQVMGQLCILSDEFDGQQIDASWSHYKPELYHADVSSGKFNMEINATVCGSNCPWFHTSSAGFVYKLVVGDFDVIAAVESLEASGANAGQDISNDTQLGGLMARNKDDASENYIFNVVGQRFDVASVETKSTTNGHSGTIRNYDVGSTRAELRIVRIDSAFSLYSRDLGATTWTPLDVFVRLDMPDTLQVGLIAYAFQSFPVDLEIKVDYIRFSEVIKTNSWIGGNGMWHDPSRWSLGEVPDSTHVVIIDNPQTQTIEIASGENFDCYTLDITDELTEFIVDGELHVYSEGCDN